MQSESQRELFIQKPAQSEISEAFDWYAARDERVAERLLDEFERVARLIHMGPHRWPKHRHGTHKLNLHGFPYAIIYEFDDAVVKVVAFAHTSRNPDYWAQRAEE